MSTPASIQKHPIHPMLVAFPIGLWGFSLACDIFYHAGPQNPFWKTLAFYSMAGGIIGALLAAVPGFIDYLSLTDARAKKIATIHMVLNLVVVVMFVFNLGIRYNGFPSSDTLGTLLSLAGVAGLCVSGWLGGALVFEHQVGVTMPKKEEERRIDSVRRAA
jgi:uncharacterized membrane protein